MNFKNFKFLFSKLSWTITTLLLLMIGSCSSSEIGGDFAKSFDVESDEESSEVQINKTVSKEKLPPKQTPKKKPKLLANKRKVTLKKNTISYKPQPYRITIKLSGANPSAPAETVTKALRKAGVRFEVERIERVLDESSSKVVRPTRMNL